jgi:hypothetical protein
MPSLAGDFDDNEVLDVADIDSLSTRIRLGGLTEHGDRLWLFPRFDVNGDSRTDLEDHSYWVTSLKKSWLGDSNLDGEYNSSDIVTVFQSGQYEDDVNRNASWATGDWNADGDFTTSDLALAFQDGGYEKGPRVAVVAVPEPTGLVLLIASLCVLLRPRTVE